MVKLSTTESRVQVAVRARPLNQREVDLKSPVIVSIHNSQILLRKPNNELDTSKTFSYDFCFDSMHFNNTNYANQEYIFQTLGEEIVQNAFEGYNTCVFAYGQTGSGKSFTMMGTHNDRGIIPRLCQTMFERISKKESSTNYNDHMNNSKTFHPMEDNNDSNTTFLTKLSPSTHVEVSYFEIYNEKIRDLLNPNNNHEALKEIETLLTEGNSYRTVASTNMNNESSRSHAVFTLKLTQTLITESTDTRSVKVSRISLVDLAGSERAPKSGEPAEYIRFQEGCNINKSLFTLDLVISTLAQQQTITDKSKKTFVPYRDSVLTWLLKDSLGGNSRTIMIATISSANDHYEETLSTLRYAEQAKKIVNYASINEDGPETIIRELQNEIDKLRKELTDTKETKECFEKLSSEINENEKLMRTITKDWDECVAETEKISKERHEILEKAGISVCSSGIGLEKDKLYLVNLNPDPSFNEVLVYYLKTRTNVGRPDASVKQDIELVGVGILSEHCVFEIRNQNQVYLTPLNKSKTYVNGQLINNESHLHDGDRILCGSLTTSKTSTMSTIDDSYSSFIDARQEVLLNQLAADPLTKELRSFLKDSNVEQRIISKKTSDAYEREIEYLKQQLTHSTSTNSRNHKLSHKNHTMEESFSKWRYSNILANDSEESRTFFSKLKQELIRVNALVFEANTI
ncbi:unnamed protein product, partial [Didymodactylos carnosus]